MPGNIDRVLQSDLTDEQYRAATDTDDEVLCLACAGSGKSRTLAYRIARLVAQGEDPHSIVAFTFTNKAAESIKRWVARALEAVGVSPTVLGAMYIGTIHSYCQYILGEMDASYRQFDLLDDNRLILFLMSRYYKDLELARLREAQSAKYFETVKQVADAWKLINDELVEIEDVIEYDALLGDILQRLEFHLRHDLYFDFSYTIRLVVEALREGDPGAERAVSELRHLMVDEYQDVNPAQEVLIRELHRRSNTLFVVGDDDQAIYQWRGADVSNIRDFEDTYPDCSSHTLSFNFRSTKAIVDAAEHFAAAELGANRVTKTPRAENPEGPRDFRTLWFDSRSEEAAWVATRINELLGKAYTEIDREGNRHVRGLTPADFAILMRSTRSSEQTGEARHSAFTTALEDLPYTLEAGGSVFERPQVQALADALELLRAGNPTRREARTQFDAVSSVFPDADFQSFADVLSKWGPQIHTPISGARRRVYPQQLVHDLLEAFGIQRSDFDDDTMQDLGAFSRLIQDAETVYLSIDTSTRFRDLLNFIANIGESGYQSSTEEVLRRPDAVTVSTVHQMKGLEFPVVFVVDVEHRRFPGDRSSYRGWLPEEAIQEALNRGAYQNTRDGERRLFYTAITRAERFLYITGSEWLPGGKRQRKESPFVQRLTHEEISTDPFGFPGGLVPHEQIRRVDETVVPTSYSEIRYYLRCPRDYQFRKSYGFSPPIPEMFGFGTTVHTSISKLHEVFSEEQPTPEQAEQIVMNTFHLKHVAPSRDPLTRPGPYERAQARAVEIAEEYVTSYHEDFYRRRQMEVRFEIPVRQAVISGAIDLLLRMDEEGYIRDASVIDFKAIEGDVKPEENVEIHWTELALQVQLYAKAARDVLGEEAKTGAVHLLKDNQRVHVPISDEAVNAAVQNLEWAVDRIIEGDFPMRPESEKCEECDFKALCPRIPQQFGTEEVPPPIYLPGGRMELARAFSEYETDG